MIPSPFASVSGWLQRLRLVPARVNLRFSGYARVALLSISMWATGCDSRAADSAALSHASSQPAVVKLGDMEYQVTRKHLDAAIDSLQHNRKCHILPFEREGRIIGVRVFGIPRDSLPRQVAIQNGDMIADVNGIPLSSASDIMRVRDEFRRAQQLAINFERDGKPMKLVVRIPASAGLD